MITLRNTTQGCEVPIKITNFPAGETLVNIPEMSNYIRNRDVLEIHCLWQGAEDTANIMQLRDILNRYEVDLNLPYVPYSRQDRRCNAGDSHSLAVFAGLINSLNFRVIRITDPHSDVVEALFPTAYILRQYDVCMATLILDGVPMGRYSAVVAPDLGASKKAQKVATAMKLPMIQCTKKRDPATGQLSSPQVDTSNMEMPVGSHFLIVDDICDGGFTFIQLAQAMKSIDPDVKLDLFVTHGFFTKGKQCLYDAGYENVFCYNDFSKIGETK